MDSSSGRSSVGPKQTLRLDIVIRFLSLLDATLHDERRRQLASEEQEQQQVLTCGGGG